MRFLRFIFCILLFLCHWQFFLRCTVSTSLRLNKLFVNQLLLNQPPKTRIFKRWNRGDSIACGIRHPGTINFDEFNARKQVVNAYERFSCEYFWCCFSRKSQKWMFKCQKIGGGLKFQTLVLGYYWMILKMKFSKKLY